jgi:hypothetical protein
MSCRCAHSRYQNLVAIIGRVHVMFEKSGFAKPVASSQTFDFRVLHKLKMLLPLRILANKIGKARLS